MVGPIFAENEAGGEDERSPLGFSAGSMEEQFESVLASFEARQHCLGFTPD